MAVNGGMDAPKRRIVFGVNVVVQAVLVVVVIAAVIWLGGRFSARADLTGSGRNSLSSRTVHLLRGLDQNIRITGVFAEPDKHDALGQKHRRQLRDLLDLYDSAGGARVSTYLLDPSLEKPETDKLLKRLVELPAYKDEAQPHREALEKFAQVNTAIKTLASSEYASVEELRRGEIPRFGQAVRSVRDYLNNIELLLQSASSWMAGEGLDTPGMTPELRTFFEESPKRYEPVLTEIRDLLKATEELKDVKVEELYSGLTRWQSNPPVLVESEREARIIPYWELWTYPPDPNMPVGPDGDDRVFSGEAAISSAILQLTQKDKTAVIFTRFGGQPLLRPDFSQMNPMMMRQMPRAPYQDLNQLLEKANFVTEEWDVSQQKTPPKVEDAARTVYIVFPPTPPPRPDPRRPSPEPSMSAEDRKAVLDAIAASGKAIFMAGWTPPESPMPGARGDYEYADHLKSTWGIDVRYDRLALQFMPHPEQAGQWIPAGRRPEVLTTDTALRLTDHPIAAPLKADRAGFMLTCPLAVAEQSALPAGVTVDALVEVRPTKDVWAVADVMRLQNDLRQRQAVTPGADDEAAPFPIAVAASNDKDEKVLVFGSEQFASDSLAQASGLHQRGKALLLGLLYPANSDLLINGLHWLTGEADRIAVGPRGSELPRLADLDEETARALPWLLVGVWPAVALVVGIGVWLVRRR